jgi:Ubiquitin carboxyl-terminal hydrolase
VCGYSIIFCRQDAKKGIIFERFPPVLHLHLTRFQYDPIANAAVKFNGRCEFPELLDLSPFIQGGASPEDFHYLLHAVLVHRSACQQFSMGIIQCCGAKVFRPGSVSAYVNSYLCIKCYK